MTFHKRDWHGDIKETFEFETEIDGLEHLASQLYETTSLVTTILVVQTILIFAIAVTVLVKAWL